MDRQAGRQADRQTDRDMGWEHVQCIHVAYDRYQWRALVSAVMNLPVPAGYFFTI